MKEGPISSSSNFNHVPIMGKEIIQALRELPSELTKKGLIIDATIGGGGHSAQILENFPGIKIIGIDQDPMAREAASKKLIRFGTRIKIIPTPIPNPPLMAISGNKRSVLGLPSINGTLI